MAEGGILGLIFEIAADPSKAQAAMAELKASTVAESTEISNIWSGAMDAIAGPAGIATGLFVGLGGGMVELAHHAAEAGAEIYEASKKTALSAEELSGLRVTATSLGESFDGLTMSLGRFGVNIQRGLKDSTGTAGEDLKELMGSTQAVEKLGLLPMDQRVQAVTKALFAMKDEAERNRIAADLFGRAWQTNFETFQKLGLEGFDPMIQKAKDLHQMYGPGRAAEAKAFTEKWNDLKQTLSGLADTVGSFLIPAFTSLFATMSSAGADSPMGRIVANWNRIDEQVTQFGYAIDEQGKLWTKEDLAQRKAAEGAEEWHAATATNVEDLKKMTAGLNLAGMSWTGISVHLPAAAKALDDTGKKMRGVGDAAHWVLPHLKDVDSELKAIAEKDYGEKLRAIAEMIVAIQSGSFISGPGLTGKNPAQAQPDFFSQMAHSLQVSILPLTSFTKQFQVLASIQPQLFTGQQRIVTNLKMMAQEWTANAVPMMQWIKQFGLADVAVNQFVQTAYHGFQQVGQALATSAANALVFGSNFGKAMEQAVKSTAQSIAAEAILWVLKCTALGFYYLAVHDAPDAALAFEAAGIWGAIGGAAAGVGVAIPGGGGGGAGGSGGGGVNRGAPNTTSGSPRGLGGVSGNGSSVTVNVNIQGVVSPDTIDLLTPSIAASMSSAIQSGMVPKWGTGTVAVPNRTAGR